MRAAAGAERYPIAGGRLSQARQQGSGVLQVRCRETLGKLGIDRAQQFAGLGNALLASPQLCQTGRRSQFPGKRLLSARPVERPYKVVLGGGKIGWIMLPEDTAFDA